MSTIYYVKYFALELTIRSPNNRVKKLLMSLFVVSKDLYLNQMKQIYSLSDFRYLRS